MKKSGWIFLSVFLAVVTWRLLRYLFILMASANAQEMKSKRQNFIFESFWKLWHSTVENWVLYLKVLMGLINYDFHSWPHEFNFILWKMWATWYGPYDMVLGKNIYTSGARPNFIPDIRKLWFMAFVTLSKKSAFIVPRGIPYGYSWILWESLDRINNYSNYCQTVRDVENQMVILLLIFLITPVNFLQTFYENLPFIYAIFSKYWYRLNYLRLESFLKIGTLNSLETCTFWPDFRTILCDFRFDDSFPVKTGSLKSHFKHCQK